jgi:hypothetical protein
MSNHTYYTPREAAAFLGLSPISMACWRSRGTGPSFIKLSDTRTGRVLYRRSVLKKWRADREREKAKLKPRRIRLDGQPDRRRGRPSYATRIARGEDPATFPGYGRNKTREG